MRRLEEEAARQQADSAFDPSPYVKGWQRDAVFDPSRWNSWPAGRGAGKTRGATYALLRAATKYERVQVYYVSTTIKRAVATIWDDVEHHNADLGLGGVPNLGLHTLTYPNGSKLWVTGVENRKMANDLRGRQRCKLWFIDECQDWNNDLLKYFYESCIYPRLGDVEGGVIFAGTGGPPRGFWFDRTKDPSFSRHTASAFENPAAPPGEIQRLIDKACEDRGCDISDASIQREFFAQFIADEKRQIFVVSDANLYDPADLPKGRWQYLIAADFGAVDATAVVVWGWCDKSPHLWLIKCVAERDCGASQQVALVRKVLGEYPIESVAGIVGDPGGGGAALILDLQRQHGIHMVAAAKADKPAGCVLLRDGLRSGRVKLPRADQTLIDDLQLPEWDPDAIGKAVKGHFPDRVDAALYGYRTANPMHQYQPPPPPKPPEQVMLEQMEAAQRRQREILRNMGFTS